MRWIATVLGRPLGRIAIAAVLAAAILAVASVQALELKRERDNYLYLTKTNYWALGQLPWELERFLGTLSQFMLAEPGVSYDELTLRFDLLWSRVPVLMQGPETAEVRRIEGAVALLQDFEAALAELEPLLAEVSERQREPYRRLRAGLAAFREPLHGLQMEIHHGAFSQTVRDRIVASHRRSSLYQLGMLALLALLVLHLLLELRHSGRQARRESAARVAAETANQAKSSFLAVVSHELRTPLNAIIGFAELMKQETFGPLPPRYRGYAQDIHESGRHLLAVVTSVLDMVRLGAQRLSLQEESFTPAEVVQISLRQVERACEQAGLTIKAEVAVPAAQLWGDRRLFQQIVLNLLSNAVKFWPAGGAMLVEVAVEEEGLLLRVADNGPGIAPELLDSIAEPFVQADQSHSRRHEGVGLGLSLVKGFAELHGGTLTIESRLGAGTVANVRFPAHRLRPAAAGPASSSAAPVQGAA